MKEIEVALAVSAREWPDRIHRFLADHGGARVRAQVMTPDDALAEDYQVLIIDDISSFLTPRLVAEVHKRRRMVLGVFDPEDSPDAKERLQECGVDQVIAADATADEFVVALRAMVVLAPELDGEDLPLSSSNAGQPRVWVVGAPPGGCGATEVAIALARQFTRFGSVVLVDLDEVAPALAQRLGLPLLPNLRSAIDALTHRQADLEATLQQVGNLEVLTGLSGDRDWMEVRSHEVSDVIEELIAGHRFVVINVGSQLDEVGFGPVGRFGLSRTGVAFAERVLLVTLPNPVQVSRTAHWYQAAREINPSFSATILVNRAPRSRFRRAELIEELGRATGVGAILFLSRDSEVESSVWSGQPVPAGRFVRQIRKLARSEVSA